MHSGIYPPLTPLTSTGLACVRRGRQASLSHARTTTRATRDHVACGEATEHHRPHHDHRTLDHRTLIPETALAWYFPCWLAPPVQERHVPDDVDGKPHPHPHRDDDPVTYVIRSLETPQ